MPQLTTVLIAIATLLSYFGAVLVQLFQLRSKNLSRWNWAKGLSVLAVLGHGVLLHHQIDVDGGQNLTLFNMVSLVAWLIAVLVFLSSFRVSLRGLPLFAFPLAMLSIVLALFFPGSYVVKTAAEPRTLVHILLAITTFSVLCLAGLFGLLVIVQERQLRHKSTTKMLWRHLPALQTMEKLLFQTVRFGFILLSIVLISSMYSFFDKLAVHWVIDKTIVVILAWLIFGVLLVGHRWFGWRGHKAGYSALAGVSLLFIAYLGCQFIMEGL